MELLNRLLASTELAPPLPDDEAIRTAERLSTRFDCTVYPKSIAAGGGEVFFLARKDGGRIVGRLSGDAGAPAINLLPADASSAALLRPKLPFLWPRCIGLRRTIGCGDRLGIATPGHIRACRGKGVECILAQQSIREMTRTRRSPQDVMDDATFGVFQEGFRDGYGADADHLKTPDDADVCLRAGFVMFTIDPGEHVDDEIDLPEAALDAKFEALPWQELESSSAGCRRAFAEQIEPAALVRAAVKYGRAVAHSARMYRHIKAKADGPFEIEVSVDETAAPTSPDEHRYIATELRRLGVEWVSLAPRYVGEFEKGVDYIGDLGVFERELIKHHAIARELGPYKLGFHSGSDKFSIYPIAARVCGDLLHLKTAGTSYLVAVTVAAELDPAFFREILTFARERYPEDRASYHVSARLAEVPKPDELSAEELPGIVDQFHAREVLHVMYGSVVADRPDFHQRLMKLLEDHEEEHYRALEAHIGRHVEPLIG